MATKFDSSAFKRRLAAIPAAVRKEVSKAIAKDAEEWVALSRAIAPTDPKDGTFLKDSIRHEPTETGGQIVRAGGETTTKEGQNGPYDYAIGQEFGTKDMPASPYYWPAYRTLKKRFTARRQRALNKAIKGLNDGGK